MTAVAVFLIVAAAELLWPRHEPSHLTLRRWFGNLALLVCVVAIVALADRIPVIATILGDRPAAEPWGLLPRLGAPLWLEVPAAILLLDLVAYALHRLNHSIGWLWRLHAVHHSDPELDVTTTFRQHPLSIVVQALAMAAAVALLGFSALAFALYRGVDAAVQIIAHANLGLPAPLSAALSRVLVTPEFHRQHHSPWIVETNSNYGQIFSFWDRLLGTASARAAGDRRDPEFGLEAFRDARAQRPDRMLAQPFIRLHDAPGNQLALHFPASNGDDQWATNISGGSSRPAHGTRPATGPTPPPA
jgi:sterol desaturase/sphingolipid hydroxylase (fatty acid hydroxylase superfamily)